MSDQTMIALDGTTLYVPRVSGSSPGTTHACRISGRRYCRTCIAGRNKNTVTSREEMTA